MMERQEGPRRIRALVVDDEPLARSNVKALLLRHPEIDLLGECASGAEAIEAIRRSRPDLIFLDVQMPECDGFDVIEMLGGDVPPGLIFVTAYDAYALRAFEVGALDYLLKPFDDARFERMLERAIERIVQGRSEPRKAKSLALKTAGLVSFVKMSDIDWIEAADYYVILHLGAKTHLLRRSMAELEQELSEATFCRIHRSTIVRLNRISRLELNETGEYDVLLGDGTRLRLSRRYRKQLQCRLGLSRPLDTN